MPDIQQKPAVNNGEHEAGVSPFPPGNPPVPSQVSNTPEPTLASHYPHQARSVHLKSANLAPAHGGNLRVSPDLGLEKSMTTPQLASAGHLPTTQKAPGPKHSPENLHVSPNPRLGADHNNHGDAKDSTRDGLDSRHRSSSSLTTATSSRSTSQFVGMTLQRTTASSRLFNETKRQFTKATKQSQQSIANEALPSTTTSSSNSQPPPKLLATMSQMPTTPGTTLPPGPATTLLPLLQPPTPVTVKYSSKLLTTRKPPPPSVANGQAPSKAIMVSAPAHYPTPKAEGKGNAMVVA